MLRSRAARTGVLLAGLVLGVTAWSFLGHHKHPPFFPEFRRQVSDRLYGAVLFATRFDSKGESLAVPQTVRPNLRPQDAPAVAAYASARAAGAPNPGARALRADADLYCQLNSKAVEEQARKEGLTVDEVKELTFFGLEAQVATQPSNVERVLGRRLTSDEEKKLDQLLSEENESFKTAMRQEVDNGDPPAVRQQTIATYEQYFEDRFVQTFSMSAAQFDDLLAPQGPPAVAAGKVPPPPDLQPPPPEDPRPPPGPLDPSQPQKPVVAPLKPAPQSTPANPPPGPTSPTPP